MKNRLPAVAVAAAVALGLSGCGGAAGGAAADPAGAFTSYLTALNEGDYEAALAMVASPGDLAADAIVSFGEVEFPDPEQVGADLDADATSGTVSFAVGAQEGEVGFRQVDGAWKLDVPLFVTPVLSDATTGNRLGSDLEFLGADVTLPDGDPLTGAEYLVVFDEATYTLPAEYSGGTRYDPIAYEYEVTYSPSGDGFGQVESTSVASSELESPVFSDEYSSDVIAALPETVVGESTTVARRGYPNDASYQITVDTIAESNLNECEWSSGYRLGNPATIECTPTQYTVTFTTDWPGYTDAYAADVIGGQAHAAGTSFTYNNELGDAGLWLRLVDETYPGELSDPRESALEYGGQDLLDFPAP